MSEMTTGASGAPTQEFVDETNAAPGRDGGAGSRDGRERRAPRAARPDLELSATCPAGFEAALAAELRGLGCARVRPLKGSVSFAGDVACALRACLWSRLASRIVLVLKRVGCATADELYEGVAGIAWEDHIARGATLAVSARGGNDELHDPRFAAMRVKDAVVDRLRERRGERPDVDSERPDIRLTCAVHDRRATIGLDLSGEPLIDRGYRVRARGRSQASPTAFLREDLAAFVLAQGDWPRRSRRDARSVLVDPLGVSPVLGVEAACVACDRAPGLTRERWGFDAWLGFDEAAWAEEIGAADERFDAGLATGRRVIVAARDAGVRGELLDMAKRAHVLDAIEVVDGGPSALDLGQSALPSSLVACVIGDEGLSGVTGDQPARLATVAALLRTPALREAPLVALEPGDALGYLLGYKPESHADVRNGSARAIVASYPSAAQAARLAAASGSADGAVEGGPVDGGASSQEDDALPPVPVVSAYHDIALPDGSTMGVLVPASDQFAARLAKVGKQRAKWAKRTGVSCYRVYDADLPDYAVAVDLYQGSAQTPGRWLVMSEYAAPKEIDEALAARRLADALAIAPRVLGVDPEDVFLKVRKRAKGGSQYASDARSRRGRGALVEEGGLTFEVNFSDYLDTGIFLDHRDVRGRIREMADRARFLNLFAYTGTASCYAADGGAFSTTTVDLSSTYLDWARRNMEQNGFSGAAHEYIQADVMPWIQQTRHTALRWDLIFIDPPTFSNSAKMRQSGFDVQRDHAELLIGASRLLFRGGQILFSCNLRGFAPDREALAKAGLEIHDVTEGTIPEDFSRNAKIHHVYTVRRFD